LTHHGQQHQDLVQLLNERRLQDAYPEVQPEVQPQVEPQVPQVQPQHQGNYSIHSFILSRHIIGTEIRSVMLVTVQRAIFVGRI
jgi:hypothetical protein